jgi:hypothetical protein
MKTQRCHFIHYNEGPDENKRCKNKSEYNITGYMFGDKSGVEVNACVEHYGDLVNYPQIFWNARKRIKA